MIRFRNIAGFHQPVVSLATASAVAPAHPVYPMHIAPFNDVAGVILAIYQYGFDVNAMSFAIDITTIPTPATTGVTFESYLVLKTGAIGEGLGVEISPRLYLRNDSLTPKLARGLGVLDSGVAVRGTASAPRGTAGVPINLVYNFKNDGARTTGGAGAAGQFRYLGAIAEKMGTPSGFGS